MTDKWEWELELKKARLTQQEVGDLIGLTKSQMSHLVKKMIAGQGLIASRLDQKRWNQALEYIDFKKQQITKELNKGE